ncbi:hypothetical protein X777_04186 [Ooceraea biroi]|uniref:Uncharacterized protein n=1 Tax=Ooceraea biroi TaxID=2015173 RepID=A0A026WI04_OOCBI|nr:hypothetical protein X777_04186 [Ooceraea biroi]
MYERLLVDEIIPAIQNIFPNNLQQIWFQHDGAPPHFGAGPRRIFKEIHSRRTLTKSGVKTVEAMIQSISSTTHSYTIMPIISASGRLLSPLYIVLKESTGTFGPRVEETLFRPVNIYIQIQASKLGKLTV